MSAHRYCQLNFLLCLINPMPNRLVEYFLAQNDEKQDRTKKRTDLVQKFQNGKAFPRARL